MAFQGASQQLADNEGMQGNTGELLVRGWAATVGRKKSVFDAHGTDADEHNFVAQRCRIDLASEERPQREGWEATGQVTEIE
jgi:hypothetical protein